MKRALENANPIVVMNEAMRLFETMEQLQELIEENQGKIKKFFSKGLRFTKTLKIWALIGKVQRRSWKSVKSTEIEIAKSAIGCFNEAMQVAKAELRVISKAAKKQGYLYVENVEEYRVAQQLREHYGFSGELVIRSKDEWKQICTAALNDNFPFKNVETSTSRPYTKKPRLTSDGGSSSSSQEPELPPGFPQRLSHSLVEKGLKQKWSQKCGEKAIKRSKGRA